MTAIKTWFLEKNNIKGFYGKELEIIKETAKAVLIRVAITGDIFTQWVPKSVIIDEWEKGTSNFGYRDYLIETFTAKAADSKDFYITKMTSKELIRALTLRNIAFMSKNEWVNR